MEMKAPNISWKTVLAFGGAVATVIIVSKCCGYSCDFQIGSCSLNLKPNDDIKKAMTAVETKPTVVECVAAVVESPAQ